MHADTVTLKNGEECPEASVIFIMPKLRALKNNHLPALLAMYQTVLDSTIEIPDIHHPILTQMQLLDDAKLHKDVANILSSSIIIDGTNIQLTNPIEGTPSAPTSPNQKITATPKSPSR